MKPAAGRRDTLVTIEHRVETQNTTFGSYSYTWSTLGTEWAEVQDILPSRSESVATVVNMQRRPCRVRMLYRDDVTSAMRLKFDGRTVQIIGGPVELGRRDGLEMVCEDWSTQGEAE